jgi:DNA-binding GntR family transcriptional regulator
MKNKNLKRHEAIYRAIQSRDVHRARAAMRKHLEETISLVGRLVEQQQNKER